ncbi:2-oxoacid:acceptor oxidoreductase family protein [bacterium]|nr:2-oxoacid:acceptor oxidoreductase family protein [candidate division CSSED10-310 bacterium]
MQTEIIIAGFGGQGIMLIGQMLSYAALAEGRETCWIPSYGPEMRGGTANCTIVVADNDIGSPIIYSPQCAMVFNRPSLDKFGPMVKPGGLLFINSSLIDVTLDRDDIAIFRIPANAIAINFGNTRGANMVMLGAYLGVSRLVTIESVLSIVKMKFQNKPDLIELNRMLIERGYEIGLSGEKEVQV